MDKPVSAWGRQKIRLMRTSLSASALALLMSLPAFGQSPPSPDLAYIGSVELRPERSELSAGWTIQILDPTLETIELALAASFGTALVTGSGALKLLFVCWLVPVKSMLSFFAFRSVLIWTLIFVP